MIEHGEELIENAGAGASVIMLQRTVTLRSMTHLLGAVGGRDVLDLVCGDGTLSRWLAAHGARVLGVDRSLEAVESARIRETQEPRGINYLVGDPEDLYTIDDSSFDYVICNLSLPRIENLAAVVGEVARVIRLGGRFLFSVSHPCFDLRFPDTPQNSAGGGDYFSEGPRITLGGGIRHRTLSTYINAVAARGFTVRRLLEPSANERDVRANPAFDIWRRAPLALVVEAVFPKI